MNSFNILITSVSAKVPLIKIIREAANKVSPEIKLLGADNNVHAIAQYFVDNFWLMPKLNELTIDNLIEECLRRNIRIIIPTRDGELKYFAQYKKMFSEYGIWVMVSDVDTVDLCLDKLRFCEFLLQHHLPAITTVDNIEQLNADYYVVKERYGAGSHNLGLRLSKEEAVLHAKKLITPIFQPYIEGDEVSADIFVTQESVVKGCVVRSRDLVINGESQITTVFRNSKLEDLIIKTGSVLKIKGHAVMQVMIDIEHDFKLIECNARIGGASTLSIRYGLDSFYWFLTEFMRQDVNKLPFNRIGHNLKQIRYKEDLVI